MSVDVLYPINRIQRGSNADLSNLLHEVLHVDVLKDSLNRNNILVLLHVCGYLSASDFSYFFGLPDGNFKSLHSLLNAMEKSGLIKSTTVGKKDGFSKVVYYPTELGFFSAGSMFINGSQLSYKRRSKSITTLHDYSIGQNVLHLLLYGMPFEWDRECSYSSSDNNRKSMGSLCIDGICRFLNTKHTLYFEEDLANESIGVLYKKLEKYEYYDLMDSPQKDTLIFSFRKPNITCEAPIYPSFSSKRLEELSLIMDENHLDILQDTLPILTAQGNELLVNVAKHVLELFSLYYPGKPVTRKVLLSYLKDFTELKLDIRHMEYNSIQVSFATARTRSLLGMLAKMYHGPDYRYPSFFYSIMKGFSIYGLPTSLLSNYLPYINFTQTGLHYSLPMLLGRYYPGMDASSYQSVLNPPLKMESGAKHILCLRNAFSFDKGTVCMEYVSHDVAAVLRVMRYKDLYLSSSVFVICMVDSFQDALFLMNESFINYKQEPAPALPKITFIDLSQVSKGYIRPFVIGMDLKKYEL